MIREEELKELTMADLVSYYNANQALLQHFQNEAQINECYKNTKDKRFFEEPTEKHSRCSKVHGRLIKELEKRLLG